MVASSLSQRYGDQPMRVVLDVAAVADPYTGFLIGETVDGTYTESTIGETSLAGRRSSASRRWPVRVALSRLASPTRRCTRSREPRRTTTSSPRAPYAVTNPAGSYLVTLDRDPSLSTSSGYNNVTGVGAPNGTAFLTAEDGAGRTGGHGHGHGTGHGHGHGHEGGPGHGHGR